MKGHLKKSKEKHKKPRAIHRSSPTKKNKRIKHIKKNKRIKNLVHPFHSLEVPIPVWKKEEKNIPKTSNNELDKSYLEKLKEEKKQIEENLRKTLEEKKQIEKVKITPNLEKIEKPISKEDEEVDKIKAEILNKSPDYEKKLGLPVTTKNEVEKAKDKEQKNLIAHGKILDTYNVQTNDVNTKITLMDTDQGKFYQIKLPEVSRPTQALLENVKQKLINFIDIGTAEITDINAIEKLKQNLITKATELFQKFKMPKENISFLTGLLINEMIGLGDLEIPLSDADLEEIVITSASEPVRVYHRKYGWMQTNLTLNTEKQIENYSAIIARRVGRQITTLTPMLDAHLISGDRVNAVLYPICTKGNTITIRKFAREPWTMVDFINSKTCTVDVFALLWVAIQYEMNILFSGGTASGKTTMLNVCTPFFPANHRILSIEDTRELQLPAHLYWAPLVTRLPNPEGKGEITMLDLLVNSLRMRPDRIILGEVRKHETAEVLFEAMHTGHSVYSTVHADTSSETVARMVNPPINIPPNLLKAIDLNVVMFRDRRRGLRRVFQLAELIPDESDKNGVKPNILYRWEPTNDKILSHSNSMRFFEDLSRHTGMSFTEISQDLKEKKDILNWLVKNNIRDMNSISQVIKKYYLKQGWKDIKSKENIKVKKRS